MSLPSVCIVTPALADANNGNWQTAKRWASLLQNDYRVQVTGQWQGEPFDAMLALHARRSAVSIERWAREQPGKPLVVVLTGTDLYRDILDDASAQQSLELADRLVVLHEQGPTAVPPEHRGKTIVSFQSTSQRASQAKSQRHLRALMVGHLREEKSPQTYFEAARLLADRADILLDHIGAPLDAELGAEAQSLQRSHPHYRWLAAQPHEATRRRIQRAHVLVHASRMEGGAHVVMEAIRSGTPVLASRIPGNVGMLGSDYSGYFETGDAHGLAALLVRCRDEPAILEHLETQCAARAHLFEPARERATLIALLTELLDEPTEKTR